MGQVAGDHAYRSRFDATEHLHQAVDVHGLVQAIVDSLSHQGMIRDFALALDVFETGALIGKYQGDQIFRRHALELGRDLRTGADARQGSGVAAFQRQRTSNMGASSRAWIRIWRTETERRYWNTSSRGKLWVAPSERMMPSSVAAACNSKLNFLQKRLRRAKPQARFTRLPKGECSTMCMSPASSKKRSRMTAACVGSVPSARCAAPR